MAGAVHVDDDAIAAVAAGTSDDPFAVLGRHATSRDQHPAGVFRTSQPAAMAVDLVLMDGTVRALQRRTGTIFETVVPLDGVEPHEFAYRFLVHEQSGTREVVDPYQFGQVLEEFDLH